MPNPTAGIIPSAGVWGFPPTLDDAFNPATHENLTQRTQELLSRNFPGPLFGSLKSGNVARSQVARVSIYNNNGNGRYAFFPDITLSRDGTLVYLYLDRLGSVDSVIPGAARFVTKRRASTDGGTTWSTATTVFDTEALPAYMSQYYDWDCRGISLTTLQDGGTLAILNLAYDGNTRISFSGFTDDNGLTFRDWVQIDPIPSAYEFVTNKLLEIPVGTTLANGTTTTVRKLLAAVYGKPSLTLTDKSTYVMASSDGRSWGNTVLVGDSVTDGRTYDEPQLCLLSSGRILMLIRCSNTEEIFRSTSDDGGVTWAAPASVFSGISKPTVIQDAFGAVICAYRSKTLSSIFADGVTTNTSATVTSATAAFTTDDIGKTISGTGIPANTFITRVSSATTIVMSKNATVTDVGVTITLGRYSTASVFATSWDEGVTWSSPALVDQALTDRSMYADLVEISRGIIGIGFTYELGPTHTTGYFGYLLDGYGMGPQGVAKLASDEWVFKANDFQVSSVAGAAQALVNNFPYWALDATTQEEILVEWRCPPDVTSIDVYLTHINPAGAAANRVVLEVRRNLVASGAVISAGTAVQIGAINPIVDTAARPIEVAVVTRQSVTPNNVYIFIIARLVDHSQDTWASDYGVVNLKLVRSS